MKSTSLVAPSACSSRGGRWIRRLTVAAGLLAAAGAAPLCAQVIVIAHPDVPADSLDQSRLLDFYTGDVNFWDSNTPVTVFDVKRKSPLKRAFYLYLGKSTTQMKSIWMKKLLLGESQPPDAVDSDAAMVEHVAHTPGGIGYVSADVPRDEVKTLLVIAPAGN